MLPKSMLPKMQKSLGVIEKYKDHFLDPSAGAGLPQGHVRFPVTALAAQLPWKPFLVHATEEGWNAFKQAFHCIFIENKTSDEVLSSSSSSYQHEGSLAVYKPAACFGIEIPSSLSAFCFLVMWVHHGRAMHTDQNNTLLHANHQGQCARLKNSLTDLFLHAPVPEAHDEIMLAAFEVVGMWNGDTFCVQPDDAEAFNSHTLVQRVTCMKDGCFYRKQDACPGQYLRVMLWSYLVLKQYGSLPNRMRKETMEVLLRGIAFGLHDFATSDECNVSFDLSQQAIYSRVMRDAFDAKMASDLNPEAIKSLKQSGDFDTMQMILCEELVSHYRLITSIPKECVDENDASRQECGKKCAHELGASALFSDDADNVKAFSADGLPASSVSATNSHLVPDNDSEVEVEVVTSDEEFVGSNVQEVPDLRCAADALLQLQSSCTTPVQVDSKKDEDSNVDSDDVEDEESESEDLSPHDMLVESEGLPCQESVAYAKAGSEKDASSNVQGAGTSDSVAAVESTNQWLTRYKQLKQEEIGLSSKRYDYMVGLNERCRSLCSDMNQYGHSCATPGIDVCIEFYELCIRISNHLVHHTTKIGGSSARSKKIDILAVYLEQAGFRKDYYQSLQSLYEHRGNQEKSLEMERKAQAEALYITKQSKPDGTSRKRSAKSSEEKSRSLKTEALAKKSRLSTRMPLQTTIHTAASSTADRGMVGDHSLFVGSGSPCVFQPLLHATSSMVTSQGVWLGDVMVPFDGSEAFFDQHQSSINTTLDPALGVTPLIAGLMLYEEVAASLKDQYALWLKNMLARTGTQTLNQTIQKNRDHVYHIGDQALSWAYFMSCWPLVHAMLDRQDIDLTSPRNQVASLTFNLFQASTNWQVRERELNRLFAACQTPEALKNQLRWIDFDSFIGEDSASYPLTVKVGLLCYRHEGTMNAKTSDIFDYFIQVLQQGRLTLPNICEAGFSKALADALCLGMKQFYGDLLCDYYGKYDYLASALVRVVHMEDYVAGHPALEGFHQTLIGQYTAAFAHGM